MKDIISEKIIRDRKTYEALFQKHAPKVARNSRIISRFPFVRGIMISGSVSKGLLKNDGDIDFFIITAQNRLWICRTLLILYKKIFRLNSKKFFCLNYFIGEGSLEIPDRNIFTATEIACLVPTYNEALCEKFKQANLWYKPYLPVFTQSIRFPVIETGKESALKKIVEHLFMNITGEKTDEFLMNYTYHHWQKKFSGYTPEVIELAMRSRRNVSKHHPNNFQEKVLHLLNEKIKEAGFDKDLKRKFNC
jgi:hypothetical protein